jgi:hypothetical protein
MPTEVSQQQPSQLSSLKSNKRKKKGGDDQQQAQQKEVHLDITTKSHTHSFTLSHIDFVFLVYSND